MGNSFRRQFLENRKFNGERPVGGIGNLAFQFRQFGRGKTHGIGHGLAMDEPAFRLVRIGHRARIIGRDLDEITKHIIVLDLERLDAGFLDIIGLQTGNDAA